ncbi:hypothetical protein N473_26235 [Pseudoalteromonas luteoviolacea CPMOR-1]|uniref:Uncharacterized protein n=1 Tax=Pseudoalteromonas luteoviolacea CPMOR-1 TaxID=1365248 RepID=A0A167I5D4_9GAMM|nr:hypothetical protein [Pseudoalteromonas luteoviolacea]KZN58918.1 hypothetical protein N473_26235 [Pseudoalteromonas luteoviolacea CPMOR-1]
MTTPLTKNEDLKYQLESLASYEPNDIDNPQFEVVYEDANEREGFITVCCVDVAERAHKRIEELEKALHDIAALAEDGQLEIYAVGSIVDSALTD